ncbi:MAG: bifunctional phosphopantothenoylcysteine decarboxylase/phosphopantothenate--cysteine ligase CoaBC [Selenomonadaceae bacterium]|nr:bifunctional phosphopantothenoylcysteine decarboxylase/phosphopantothenate--cysteine ligase CoaBC [Selenomonadaceae bacterium]
MMDMDWKGKKVLLGVSGGIAAYKAVEIASRMRKAGAEVHVILTRAAQEFVTELTFREISGNPVNTGMWEKVTHWNVEHIALARMADLVLVAPATANLIAKLAVGLADDMLTTTILATHAPIFLAPAMNSNMFRNPVTQKNIKNLQDRGIEIIPPASGHLACGVDGVGRLPEPVEILSRVEGYFRRAGSLQV